MVSLGGGRALARRKREEWGELRREGCATRWWCYVGSGGVTTVAVVVGEEGELWPKMVVRGEKREEGKNERNEILLRGFE